VGILGGTFNPPHLGHLALARHARDELALELVLLMPARIAPHKPAAEDPGPGHRLRMCQLLVGDSTGLSVNGLEIERPGPSYTVDTLSAIDASHPDVELTFIVGADIASTLPAWREPAKILELARLAVAGRAGTPRRDVLDTAAALTGTGDGGTDPPTERVQFLDMPAIEVSSSLVRARVSRGEAIEELVGPAVAGYIVEHGLYGARRDRARRTAGAQ
jgi:nicotinate-nucleotide adenylyltransferase